MEFFPQGTLDDRPDGHAFRVNWYVPHLLSMQEQPLYPAVVDRPAVYRLLFLPTFGHPVVVRLTEAAGGGWRVVCKRSDGRGGYGPGPLVSQQERDLLPAEARQLGRLLEGAGFWVTPSFKETEGLDGSQAVLEGVCEGRYHVVDRWSPRGTPYAELVQFLLKLGRS
jgi:hypothetical protein